MRLKVVAGSVGRAEEGCAKFGGSAVGWSATAGMLVARGDVAGGAKGRDIGTVGGRLSGTVASALEGSDPAAGFLSIRSPDFDAGALCTADSMSTLGARSLVAGSAASLAVRAGRLSALVDKTLSIIPGAPNNAPAPLTTLALASATATLEAPVCNG